MHFCESLLEQRQPPTAILGRLGKGSRMGISGKLIVNVYVFWPSFYIYLDGKYTFLWVLGLMKQSWYVSPSICQGSRDGQKVIVSDRSSSQATFATRGQCMLKLRNSEYMQLLLSSCYVQLQTILNFGSAEWGGQRMWLGRIWNISCNRCIKCIQTNGCVRSPARENASGRIVVHDRSGESFT